MNERQAVLAIIAATCFAAAGIFVAHHIFWLGLLMVLSQAPLTIAAMVVRLFDA